jgi:hypothetical protein
VFHERFYDVHVIVNASHKGSIEVVPVLVGLLGDSFAEITAIDKYMHGGVDEQCHEDLTLFVWDALAMEDSAGVIICHPR